MILVLAILIVASRSQRCIHGMGDEGVYCAAEKCFLQPTKSPRLDSKDYLEGAVEAERSGSFLDNGLELHTKANQTN